MIHIKNPSFEDNYVPPFFSSLKSCFTKVTLIHDVDCSKIYRHITGDPTTLTMIDIDMLWLCFYATGDLLYSNNVKSRAMTKKNMLISDSISRTAAEWSYNNHVLQKFIHGPEIIKPTNTNTINNSQFFSQYIDE